MKSLKESLFDSDLVNNNLVTLFNIAKDRTFAIKRYEYTKNSIRKYVDLKNIMKLWKKIGSPELSNIINTSLSSFENKVISTILSRMVIDKNGEIDNDTLNEWLNENGVLTQSQIGPAKWSDTIVQVYFVNPREPGAWMHKNFKNGPVQKECYEIEVQFRHKENNSLGLAIEMCLNIKWNQMDEILGK